MKFLFLVSDFNTGGITSSLRNLTNELVSRGHKISVLNLPMAKERPGWMSAEIELIELSGKARLWNLSGQTIKNAKWYKKIPLLALGFIKKLMNKLGFWIRFIFSNLSITEKYDYAVAFRQEPTSIWIVKNKINADLKVSFWHSDPNVEDTSAWDKCIDDLDVVAGVSNYVCDALVSKHPQVVAKTVYNLFDAEQMKHRSNLTNPNYPNTFNIVTVSRIEFSQKNLDRIPTIAEKLKSQNLNFHWTVVGGGPHMQRLHELVHEKNVEDCVELVGAQENPYPYIKQADLFVLTSSWESYGMVVVEALILNTPVVAGDYPALKEILEDGVTGIIAENSEDGIYNGVYKLITDHAEYKHLKENCSSYVYSADVAYEQFINLGKKEQI